MISIRDATDAETLNLKKTIYLTIMSALDFEECAHKLMKIDMKEGQEPVLVEMIIECCSQERTFTRFFGLLAQRFCLLRREYMEAFCQAFCEHVRGLRHVLAIVFFLMPLAV